MTNTQSRRAFVRLAAATASTAGLVAISGHGAEAYQGKMEQALFELQNALRSLHQASSDKGGHKHRAAELVQQAIAEVQAGIDYAASHFGD